jgi:UDP-2,3-diacylglucosamine pyrophosphatase LpxH
MNDTNSESTGTPNKTHFKAIFISDVHLGTWGCQAQYLAGFLKSHTCDTLYLVGDIIDGWQLQSKVFWPQTHTNVVRRILTLSKRGTRVVFVTGNHDEFLRRYAQRSFGNIELVNEIDHVTQDGRRFLVVHGDQFDAVTRCHKGLAMLGSTVYDHLIRVNAAYNKVRARMGYGYWSLSAFLKHKVKTAVNFISEFENWVAKTAHKRGYDGVVCGHIHHAEIRDIEGVTYMNCGDWVESCTALAEDDTGKMHLINWIDVGTKDEDVAKEKVNPLDLLAELGSAEKVSPQTKQRSLSGEVA